MKQTIIFGNIKRTHGERPVCTFALANNQHPDFQNQQK